MALATISSGRLLRVVTLQQPTTARDGYGQPVKAYADSTAITPAARRARVRMLSSRELVAADTLLAEADFEVTLRYIPDSMPARQTLTASTNFADDDTVVLDSKTYTFQSPLSNGADGDVAVGDDLEESLLNLFNAINLVVGGDYGTAMTIHPTVTAVTSDATTLVISAKLYGTSGNTIASTVGGGNTGNGTWGATTLAGGATTGGRLTSDYRLSLDDGDTLEIVSVLNQERQAMTVCRCKRTTSG